MAFWSRSRKGSGSANAGRVRKSRKTARRVAPAATEVELLALEALEAGLSPDEVGELAGVGPHTIHKWRGTYSESGVEGLCRKTSSIAVRRQCSVLAERIVAHRRAHPEHGIRRIRDDLRRPEGREVSAEKVRVVVSDAGLNNPPPRPHRLPPGIRRFERVCPNARWQVDIFTFHLERMYQVYLVGVIDDHSRYLVGWGLFRQQSADAVLEVIRGAIGQWGAPRQILSDNGHQFVAWRGETRFQRMLKQQGISHVRGAPHYPMTLGKIERFWRTIWQGFLSEAVFASLTASSRQTGDSSERRWKGREGNGWLEHAPAGRSSVLAGRRSRRYYWLTVSSRKWETFHVITKPRGGQIKLTLQSSGGEFLWKRQGYG